jgi:uncharacterized membrane protein
LTNKYYGWWSTLWRLAVVVLAQVAVMLFVTHRINKRTYCNDNKEIPSNL